MKLWFIRLCTLALLWPSWPFAQELSILHIAKPRAANDPAYLYFSGLLQRALQKGANGRTVPQLVTTIEMTEDRMFRELRADRLIDIFWFGVSKERARDLLVVPIPLERGLMGYRKFIIRKDSVSKFDAVNTLADLVQLKACQGAQWSDTEILKAASLRLVTSVNYESLFKQLVVGRCDYFPRGFHQGKTELVMRAQKYPELMVYEPLILYYPLASHFFVHPKNSELSKWLQDGLEQMIVDGELITYMQQHEYTRRAFPLADGVVRRLLKIENPYLPDISDEKNTLYWFQPSDFLTVKSSAPSAKR